MLTKLTLITLLKEKGIVARRSLGQNFLVDHNFLKFIVKTTQLSKDDYALEIGSGPGLLTELIAQQVRYVWAVEMDRKLFELAKELHKGIDIDNVCLINENILDSERINPVVEENILCHTQHLNPAPIVIRGQMNSKTYSSPLLPDDRCGVKVISNLPYASAAPIILALLESRLPIHSMVLMVQWEMAQRLTAPIGTKAYNALTILVNFLAEVKIVRKIAPDVFYPPPKVTSALITMRHKTAGLMPEEYQSFKQLVQSIFHYRRKTIKQGLKQSTKLPIEKIMEILERSHISCFKRPEEISAQSYLNLLKYIVR